MRRSVAVATAVLVLIALALGAAAVFLPRVLEGAAVRERLRVEVERASGHPVAWRELRVGWLPPVVEVAGAELGDPEDPVVAADRARFRLALAPLLASRVVFEEIEIAGATIRLVRDESGLHLPRGGGPPSADAGEATPGAEGDGAAGTGPRVSVRDLEVADSTFVFLDRTVDPPARLEFVEVSGTASFAAGTRLRAVRVRGRTPAGGEVDLRAQLGAGSAVDLELRVRGLPTLAVAAWLPERSAVRGGWITGSVVARGDLGGALELGADLRVEDTRLTLGELSLSGAVGIRADLEGNPPTGPFEIDADAAEIVYGDGIFTKPAGRPGRATGRVVSRGGGVAVDDLRVRIGEAEARGSLRLGPPRELALAAPLALSALAPLLPVPEGAGLEGRLVPDGFRVRWPPPEVRGVLRLDPLRYRGVGGAVLHVSGPLLGEGDALAATGLAATLDRSEFELSGRVGGLRDEPSYEFAVAGASLPAESIVRLLRRGSPVLTGPFRVQAVLGGPVAGPFAETVRGRAAFDGGPGTIAGTSLLQAAFEQLGAVASKVHRLGRVLGQQVVPFYDEGFERLAGSFEVGGGFAETRDLRIEYPHYRVELTGRLELATLGLQASGRLVLDRQVDAAIRRGLELLGGEPEPRTLELARIRGTLQDPEVELSATAVAGFLASYALDAPLRALGGLLRRADPRRLVPSP